MTSYQEQFINHVEAIGRAFLSDMENADEHYGELEEALGEASTMDDVLEAVEAWASRQLDSYGDHYDLKKVAKDVVLMILLNPGNMSVHEILGSAVLTQNHDANA